MFLMSLADVALHAGVSGQNLMRRAAHVCLLVLRQFFAGIGFCNLRVLAARSMARFTRRPYQVRRFRAAISSRLAVAGCVAFQAIGVGLVFRRKNLKGLGV